MEKFPWVSRGKCGKVSVGGCQAATCGHLRPLEWLPLRRECWRPLAATCGHLWPLAATRVAASGCKWLPVTRECWRLQVAASGCRLQENAGGHLRPLAATRVAASGCHFQNQITRLLRAQCEKMTPSEHFWKLRCRKSARRCGPKHISKSKCAKHVSLGALLEVEMFKKCMPLWREARFQVKMYKTPHARTTFEGSDVALRGRRKGLCTLSKVSKT